MPLIMLCVVAATMVRFGVVLTIANNASVTTKVVNQQLCRLRGAVRSLRGVGWAEREHFDTRPLPPRIRRAGRAAVGLRALVRPCHRLQQSVRLKIRRGLVSVEMR